MNLHIPDIIKFLLSQRPNIQGLTVFIINSLLRLFVYLFLFVFFVATTMDDASRQLDFSNNDCIYPIIKVIAKTK